MSTDYPIVEETRRPFRIWDELKKKNLPWLCYTHLQNAHIGAWKELRFKGNNGDVYTVYDITSGKAHSKYGKDLYPDDWPIEAQRGKPFIAILDLKKLPKFVKGI